MSLAIGSAAFAAKDLHDAKTLVKGRVPWLTAELAS